MRAGHSREIDQTKVVKLSIYRLLSSGISSDRRNQRARTHHRFTGIDGDGTCESEERQNKAGRVDLRQYCRHEKSRGG